MELKRNLSENIRLLRKMRGATLENFSNDIGISKSTLQEIESGKANVTLDTVNTIAQGLKVSPTALLAEDQASDLTPLTKSLLQTIAPFCALPSKKREAAMEQFCGLVRLLSGEPL